MVGGVGRGALRTERRPLVQEGGPSSPLTLLLFPGVNLDPALELQQWYLLEEGDGSAVAGAQWLPR